MTSAPPYTRKLPAQWTRADFEACDRDTCAQPAECIALLAECFRINNPCSSEPNRTHEFQAGSILKAFDIICRARGMSVPDAIRARNGKLTVYELCEALQQIGLGLSAEVLGCH